MAKNSYLAVMSEGLMNAAAQGLISGICGGDVGQGFVSGMLSSVVSSVNMSIGLSGTAGDISTMLFGSVSGGLGATLTGGNFWQGAAIGLTVSALNHVAHKIEQRAYDNKVLRDFAEKYFGDTEGFKRSRYTTRAPRGMFKNDDGFFEDKKTGSTSWGRTNPKTGKVHVSRAAYEDSFARFYITVGHETIHSVFRRLDLSYNSNVDHATISDWMLQQANVFGNQSLISEIQDYAAPFQKYIGIKPEVDWRKTGIIVRTKF